MSKQVVYKATRTAKKLHRSRADVKAIMGPIGSGKSVACIMDILATSKRQKPGKDGVRYTKWAVVRNTYPELRSTTIETWKEWIPESVCPIVYGSPIKAHMRQPLGDGTEIDMEVFFISLDKDKDVRKLLSLELTGVFINECRELRKVLIDAAMSRTSRYPGPNKCDEITWTGMIMDTNPCDDDHWYHDLAENIKPDNWEFFRQPGALLEITDTATGRITGYTANTEAENINNLQLGFQYYMRLVQSADPEWVKVHCCGKYGVVFSGKPVYKGAFIEDVHVSNKPLGMYKGLPLQLGWDFGLTPSCVIAQVSPKGQLRVLRELVCDDGGIKQFYQDQVKPMLSTLFPGMPLISGGDPAGGQRSQADSDVTCLSTLKDMGLPTSPIGNNNFVIRRNSVIDRLTRNIGGEPAVIIDKQCKMLIAGFKGGYKFERVQVVGDERFRDKPCKNKWSHVHDAFQYLTQMVDTVILHEPEAIPAPPENNWGGIL